MKTMVWVIGVLFVLMALTSCGGTDPRNLADAEATRSKAAQDAADQAAARAQREAEAGIKLAEAQAASQQWIASWNNFVHWTMITLTVAVGGTMLATGFGVSWAVVGAGRAAYQKSWVSSNLIGMDERTRSFPMMLQHIGSGRFTLTNMNTGMVLPLDVRNSGDRQLIATAGAIQLTGALGYEARKAKDSAGVALIGTHPSIVGAHEAGLEVGEYLNEENSHAN